PVDESSVGDASLLDGLDEGLHDGLVMNPDGERAGVNLPPVRADLRGLFHPVGDDLDGGWDLGDAGGGTQRGDQVHPGTGKLLDGFLCDVLAELTLLVDPLRDLLEQGVV